MAGPDRSLVDTAPTSGGGYPTPVADFVAGWLPFRFAQAVWIIFLTLGRVRYGLTVGFGGIPLSQNNVYIVDDDREVRRSLSFMLGTADLLSRPFASGVDFLDGLMDLKPGCVLLDIRMPQVDGFQVMAELSDKKIEWPVIVMTGHGEVSVAVRAMKLGAVDFLEKPFEEQILLSCLERAFTLLKDRGETAERKQRAQDRVNALTGREREVLQGLMAGMANKLLARRLDISLRTVEMHRANMMDRLGVGSLAEALTLAVQAGVEPLGPA